MFPPLFLLTRPQKKRMKIGSVSLPNIPPNRSWILPLVSLAAWWAMLTALLICWVAQGRPILDTYHHYMTVYIVYLSNIAATNLQPIFICGSAIMGIFYVWAVIEDYYLRTPEKNYLPATFHWFVTALHALAIAMAIIASLCILMVSCLKDNWQYSREHSVFVVLFVIFVFCYLVAHSLVFILYYRHYKIKYFLNAAIVKLVWMFVAIVFVVCYGAFMGKGNSDGNHSIWWGFSAIMEWTLVYFYGTMMFLISWDLRRKNYGDFVSYYINKEDSQNQPSDSPDAYTHDNDYHVDAVSKPETQGWNNTNPFEMSNNSQQDYQLSSAEHSSRAFVGRNVL